MAEKRAKFIVGVLTPRNYIQFATAVNMAKRTAAFEPYAKAVEMTMREAKILIEGLRKNDYNAVMLREEDTKIYYNRRLFDNGGNEKN